MLRGRKVRNREATRFGILECIGVFYFLNLYFLSLSFQMGLFLGLVLLFEFSVGPIG